MALFRSKPLSGEGEATGNRSSADQNSSSPTRLTQTKRGYRTTFQFDADQLEYTFRDRSGEVKGRAFYNNIDLQNVSELTFNATRHYSKWGLVAALFASIAVAGVTGSDTAPAVPFIVLFVIYTVLRSSPAFPVTISVLRTNAPYPIRIIQDTSHDEIMARIQGGSIDRLRRLMLPVNIAAGVQAEGKKYQWLLDKGIISKPEYDLAVAQLRVEQSDAAAPGEGRVLN